MNNIAIVGLGNMGLAHLNSFLINKKSFNLFLFDKNKQIIRKLKKSINNDKNISIFKNYPKGFKFDLAIIATKSIERFKVISKIIKYNKVRHLLLEKFVFNKLSDYEKFNKLNKHKLEKTYVNVWSKQFLKLIKLKKNKRVFYIKVELPEKRILTNLIHFYEIFKILVKNKIKINLDFFRLKKVKKNYYDGKGKIILKDIRGSIMEIVTKKKNNNFTFNYRSNYSQKKVKVISGNILINKKIIIPFPLASRETRKFFQKIILKKKTLVPNYLEIEKSSKEIINALNNKYKKKIAIY